MKVNKETFIGVIIDNRLIFEEHNKLYAVLRISQLLGHKLRLLMRTFVSSGMAWILPMATFNIGHWHGCFIAENLTIIVIILHESTLRITYRDNNSSFESPSE